MCVIKEMFYIRFICISSKKIVMNIILFLCFINILSLYAAEPIVILEYSTNNSTIDSDNSGNNKNFMKDFNHSNYHNVTNTDTLSKIIYKYYGKSGLNHKVIELAIVSSNSRAFVRSNPHYMYAGKKIYLPSINEIRDLVIKKPNKVNIEPSNNNKIYFFGG